MNFSVIGVDGAVLAISVVLICFGFSPVGVALLLWFGTGSLTLFLTAGYLEHVLLQAGLDSSDGKLRDDFFHEVRLAAPDYPAAGSLLLWPVTVWSALKASRTFIDKVKNGP